MSDEQVRPATDAELEEIRARAAGATPGPWRAGSLAGQCHLDHAHGRGGCDYRAAWHDDTGDVYRYAVEDGDPLGGRQDADLVAGMWDYDQGGVRRPEDARFIAAARADVPALLAAVAERDHLVYVMSRDGDAYQRGREDGRRECVEELRDWAAQARGAFELEAEPYLRKVAVEIEGRGQPPPLPPDRLRAENARLRAALARLVDAVGDVPAGQLCDARDAARAALSR